jgi:hypothetical protein
MSTFYDTLNAQYNNLSNTYNYLKSTPNLSSGATYIDSARADLKNVNLDITSNISEQNKVITQQDNVQRILDREQKRLDQKKNAIDTIMEGQRRMADFNSSYTERYRAYNNIIIFTMIMAAISFIVMLFTAYGIIPGALATFLYVVLIAIFVIMVFNKIQNIFSRDQLDFNKISTNNLLTPGQAAKSTAGYSSLMGDMQNMMSGNMAGTCIGAACCASGNYFDISSSTCIVGDAPATQVDITGPAISGFTTIEQAYAGVSGTPDLSYASMDSVAPYASTQSINYSRF